MPVNGWSDNRGRQFEHIKESLLERGAADCKAAEIGAPKVTKVRVITGEAKSTAKPSKYDLSARPPGKRSRRSRTLEQLYEDAKNLGIHGRSDMNKQELQREVDRKKRQ